VFKDRGIAAKKTIGLAEDRVNNYFVAFFVAWISGGFRGLGGKIQCYALPHGRATAPVAP
jgi:hypothetical protein